jgi:hypothetical protein
MNNAVCVVRKKRKVWLIISILVSLVTSSLYSQSNEFLDALLAQEKATFQAAGYLVLTAAFPEKRGADSAADFAALRQRGLFPAQADPGDALTLGDYSYLIMESFGIPGGIFYTLFPGPRYAVRELTYLGFIRQPNSPYRSISGTEVVSILGKVLDRYGGEQ